ncbi:MAG: class I SAM-dependent methyltransferase [Pseudomonadota bacterium]
MSDSGTFSADWLALRTAADDRARSHELMDAAATFLATQGGHAQGEQDSQRGPTHICDLGAGTGATLRALAPHLPPPQSWTLVDRDARLLAEAKRLFAQNPITGVTLTTAQRNLSDSGPPWASTPDLLTASALFDLTGAEIINRLARACAAGGVALFSMLTFDGVLELYPHHPSDGLMREAFNTHQKTDKGLGPAAGPDAPETLASAFGAHGYEVISADTPWELLASRDGEMIEAMLTGWAGAALELGHLPPATIETWLDARRGTTDRLIVGHRDQLFLPPSRA